MDQEDIIQYVSNKIFLSVLIILFYSIIIITLIKIVGAIITAFVLIPLIAIVWMIGLRWGLVFTIFAISINTVIIFGLYQYNFDEFIINHFFGSLLTILIIIPVGKMKEMGTSLEQSNQRLLESEIQYRYLFDTAPLGISVVQNDIIKVVNPKFTKMFGYQEAEQLNLRYLWEIISPDYRNEIFERTIRGGQGSKQPIHYETVGLKKDGTTFPIFVKVEMIRFNNAPAILAHIEDITEKKRKEEILKKTQNQLFLSQKMEAVGRLAGGIVHDFNNMLTVITGYISLLREELSESENIIDYLNEIENAITLSNSMIKQLQTFSLQRPTEAISVNINENITAMVRLLKRVIGGDISIITNLSPNLPDITINPTQFDQIIMNLVTNSREAMSNGGTLVIETNFLELTDQIANDVNITNETGSLIMVSVTDTGVGMDQETIECVFDPFFTTKETGTGLGLSTVYGIVKQYNGYINVKSEVNQGTTFYVYFPIT